MIQTNLIPMKTQMILLLLMSLTNLTMLITFLTILIIAIISLTITTPLHQTQPQKATLLLQKLITQQPLKLTIHLPNHKPLQALPAKSLLLRLNLTKIIQTLFI